MLSLFLQSLPLISLTLVLLFLQLLVGNLYLVSIIFYSLMYIKQNPLQLFIPITIISLLHDSIKLLPLGTYASTYFVVAIIGLLILITLKPSTVQKMTIYSVLLITLLTTVSTTGQTLLINYSNGSKIFNYSNIIFTFIISLIVVIITQYTSYKKELSFGA